MRDSSIKAYLADRKKFEISPEADEAYQQSIEKLVPEITRKLRESQARTSEFLRCSPAAARSGVKKG